MSEKRCALIENGVVVNVIFRRSRQLCASGKDKRCDVEGLQVNIGDDWDGAQFIDNRVRAPEPPRLVPKSLIVQRLIDAGKIAAANAALEADPAKSPLVCGRSSGDPRRRCRRHRFLAGDRGRPRSDFRAVRVRILFPIKLEDSLMSRYLATVTESTPLVLALSEAPVSRSRKNPSHPRPGWRRQSIAPGTRALCKSGTFQAGYASVSILAPGSNSGVTCSIIFRRIFASCRITPSRLAASNLMCASGFSSFP